MIDVAHNPTALGHNIAEKMCPLKPHQNAHTMPGKEPQEGTSSRGKCKGISKCKSNMKFLIFCWHNTTNFNIMERERTHTQTHTTQSVENDLLHTEGERIAGRRHKDTVWSLPEQMLQLSPWQFEFNLEQNSRFGMVRVRLRVDLTCAPVTAERRRKETKRKSIWFVCTAGQGRDMCNSLRGGHFALRCAINQCRVLCTCARRR